MHSPISNYLRMHRKRSGLTELEMAHLLGLKSSQIVSRYELEKRSPGLYALFTYNVVFDAEPHELFPNLFEAVEDETLARMRDLVEMLEDDIDGLAVHKRQFLIRAIKRIESRDISV